MMEIEPKTLPPRPEPPTPYMRALRDVDPRVPGLPYHVREVLASVWRAQERHRMAVEANDVYAAAYWLPLIERRRVAAEQYRDAYLLRRSSP